MEAKIEEVDDNSEVENFSIKMVIVGDSGVGKSNILTRYVNDKFAIDSKSTVGVELSTKTYKIENKLIKMHLWDTAGQERYKSITAAYYKGAKGAMIVYDITNRQSYENVSKWLGEIKELADKTICIMMVGNKADLTEQRVVSQEESINKAKELGIPIMETSALDSSNIHEAFKKLFAVIYTSNIKPNLVNQDGEFKDNMAVKINTNKQIPIKKKCCK